MAEESRKFSPVKLFSKCTKPSGVDTPNKAPIIFVHGLFATHKSWNLVNTAICKNTGRITYAIDLRNHGQSEWLDEMSMEAMIDDLENFMVTRNIPKAILIGHSVGGRVACGLALRKPQMVEKLVAEDFTLVNTDKGIENVHVLIANAEKITQVFNFLPSTMSEKEANQKLSTYLRKSFPEWFANVGSNQTVVLPFHKTKSGKFEWELNIECFSKMDKEAHHVFDVDLENAAPYDGDLLVLFAEKSYIVTEESLESFNKYFLKRQVHTFPEGKHTLHLEFPEEYIEVVSKYINEK